jgi:hypothetical protein
MRSINIRTNSYSANQFKGGLLSLWRDPVAGKSLRLSILLCLILLVIIFIFFWRLPPEIPLAYSRPWGAEQLVSSYFLFVVLMIAIFIMVINSILASFLLHENQLLARIISWVSVLVIFLYDFTVIRVILLIV